MLNQYKLIVCSAVIDIHPGIYIEDTNLSKLIVLIRLRSLYQLLYAGVCFECLQFWKFMFSNGSSASFYFRLIDQHIFGIR